jgi:DNA-binding Lrp family transcriptional regulator
MNIVHKIRKTILKTMGDLNMSDVSSTLKLDDVDFQILRTLQEDSRTSYRKIANALGIAVGTVYNRIKRLEDEGVFKAYTVMVDSTKIGYDLTASIFIQAEGPHLAEVEKEFAQSDHTICVYDITGDFDIAVIARFKNTSMLNNFIKGMLKIPHVKRTVTNVVLNVIKEDFRLKV